MRSLFFALFALTWGSSLAELIGGPYNITKIDVPLADTTTEQTNRLRGGRRLCSPSASVSKPAFATGEQVNVIIYVCQSQVFEWFGIYRAGASPGSAPAVNWQYTCGGQTCGRPQNLGAYLFGLNGFTVSQGSSTWPLPAGSYVIYYHSAFGTFSTSTFSIAGGGRPQPPPPRPTPNPTPGPTRKPTTPQTSTLSFVADNNNNRHRFPLGMCEGDCDSDADCMENLICSQRNGSEAVPGCSGNGNSGKDYCTDPSLTPPPTDRPTLPPQSNSGSFMIRLYWQSSYFWQETHAERWWCLECTKCNEYSLGDGPHHGCQVPGHDGSSCREGHTIWIRRCTDTRRHFKWQVLKNPGSGDQIRAAGSNLCLSTQNRYVVLRQCNNNNQNQLFKPISNIHRFEIRPYHQRNWSMNDAKCFTQLHHPKDKELVGLHQCQEAKNHETIYWEDYYR